MSIVDLAIQAGIAMGIPYWISLSSYKKTQKIKQWPFWVFFFVNWGAQAFMGVIFFRLMSSFEMWLCDLSVFVSPFIGYALLKKKCHSLVDEEKAHESDVIQENVAIIEPSVEESSHSVDVVRTADVSEESIEISPAEFRFCRKCGFELLAGSVFCSKCGTPVRPVVPQCPSCGKELTEKSAFCHYCGTKL